MSNATELLKQAFRGIDTSRPITYSAIYAVLSALLELIEAKPRERRYALREIKEMRDALTFLHMPGPGCYPYDAQARAAKIAERELRTAMLGGVDPEEIMKQARDKMDGEK